MKSSYQISVDFHNAENQAKKLDELADRVERRVADALKTSAEELHSVWKGDSATKYLRKENEMTEQLRQIARGLRDVASDIRRVAKRTYDAEMEALRIAQSRHS